MATLDENGHEILDATPVARAIAFNAPPSLQDQIRRMIRQQLSIEAAETGHETFEEADDFDVGDDFDPRSPWELDDDQLQAESHEQEKRRENRDAARSVRYGSRKRGDAKETGRFEQETPRTRREGVDDGSQSKASASSDGQGGGRVGGV